MRKILLSIFIMIFGFQGVAISAELIDMDSGNVLDAHVKVEALREVLNNYPKAVGGAENCFAVIPKDRFLEWLYNNYLAPNSAFDLNLLLLGCNNFAYKSKSCEIDSEYHKSGEICFEFLHDIVEQHNKLVKQETQKELQQKKIYTSESEYYETLNKKGFCVLINSPYLLADDVRTLKHCKEYCKNFAISNACSLQYVIYGDYEHHCSCDHDQKSVRALSNTYPYYFIPKWEDYVKLYNLDR